MWRPVAVVIAGSGCGEGCEADVGDSVLVDPHAKEPQRRDIFVFQAPPEADQRCGAGGTFVKRVVALPGETWAERNGYVYIDGKKLSEPYINPDRRDTATSYPPRKIGPKMYFMMGDKRTQSCDSREWGRVLGRFPAHACSGLA